MKLMVFQISGRIKEINKKKVPRGQIIKKPSCMVSLSYYPPGADYWEVVLEKCQISYGFGNESPNENVKLVFIDKKTRKILENLFSVGENYLFSCTGGVGYYFPHSWKKIN